MKKYLILGVLCLAGLVAGAQDVRELPAVHLWEGTSVKGKSVTLTPFLPEHPTGLGVIVCPGGSYFWLDDKAESHEVAKWLARNGIAGFVLKYRTAGWQNIVPGPRLGGSSFPDMLTDLQRAIQCVRESAGLYGVQRLGAMGFSAGGHLVMLASEFYDTDFLQRVGISTQVSLRPDFTAPIYPVVTMRDESCVHKRSRRGLIGERRKQTLQMKDSLSLERHVRADGPPVFLLNCTDDPVVDARNSILLDEALSRAGVDHCYIRMEHGGHGFGALSSLQNEETSRWQDLFMSWLRAHEALMPPSSDVPEEAALSLR